VAQSSDEAISLAELSTGECGRILPPGEGETIPARLRDLGFVPGTDLRILRRAPLGDPVEIELRGYRLCLRTEQITAIRVVLREDAG
jgi:ferrous iron transport protein A